MQSKMYNPETLASFGTQDTKRKQTKQKTQHNICWTPLYVNRHKNTTQHMLDTTIRKQTQNHNTTYVGHHYT